MKKIIGIDFDDVLMDFNGAISKYYNSQKGTSFTRDDIKHYRLEKLWGCETEDVTKIVAEFYSSPEHAATKPIDGAVEAIQKLRENYHLVIVTARPEVVKEQTENWISKHFPDTFQGVYYANYHFRDLVTKVNKAIICEELDIQLFIDDSVYNARDIAATGRKVFLFDAPWNQGGELYNVERVYSWKDILNKVELFSK